MQGAFGKPQGPVARAHVGQVIMSIGTKLLNEEYVIEAFSRPSSSSPGHQKIHIFQEVGIC